MKIYLSSGTGLVSWAIKKFTNSDVSHLMLSDYEDDREVVLHATAKGLHYSPKEYILEHYDVRHIFDFKLKGHIPKKNFIRLLQYIGSEYDYKSIFGFALMLILRSVGFKKARNWFGNKNLFFCSEVFAVLFKWNHEDALCPDFIGGFGREEFSPENAKQIMLGNPSYFTPCKK